MMILSFIRLTIDTLNINIEIKENNEEIEQEL